ncbi:30S ribosomal protein S4 [Methanopyrus kandleri]|jgi:small subunit ribosomal protein S4
MGDPKKPRKKYETPRHPWEAERLEYERKLMRKYGLRRKKELWRHQTQLKRWRERAKELMARTDPEAQREREALFRKLYDLGILDKKPEEATLDDILRLTVEDVLERRLQTIVYRKGLAKTPLQARQLVVHRHIAIGDRIVTVPSYLVSREEEEEVDYSPYSPLKDEDHPIRCEARGESPEETAAEE